MKFHKEKIPTIVDSSTEILESLQKKGFIKIVNDKFYLREKGKKYCKLVDIHHKIDNKSIKDDIEEWINEYRLLFKVKRIPGKMGDKKSCIEKMRKFYKEYPDYAKKNLIMNMARIYVKNEINKTFQVQADYFIFKKDNGSIWRSKLASFCEENEDSSIESLDTGKQGNILYI